jgi:hypothetical protein
LKGLLQNSTAIVIFGDREKQWGRQKLHPATKTFLALADSGESRDGGTRAVSFGPLLKILFFLGLGCIFAEPLEARQRAFGYCTVQVYLTGTTTPPTTIYSDNAGTVQGNPFTANAQTGYWEFYANSGRYDVQLSGAGIPNTFTVADILLDDAIPNIILVDGITYTGVDACAAIKSGLLAVRTSGDIVDASGILATGLSTDCTVNNTAGIGFGITSPYRLKLGALLKIAHEFNAGGSNQYVECTSPAYGFDLEPTPPIDTSHTNDRAVIFGARSIAGGLNRPITNPISSGATTFVVTNAGDSSDLTAGDWLHIHMSDPNVSDLVAFDWAQIASVSGAGSPGATVTVTQPFRTTFSNNPATLSFDRFPAGVGTGVSENQGISGCLVMSNQSAVSTPGIDVHFGSRNVTVKDNVVNMAFGQPLYSYRSYGAKFLNNKIKVQTGGSEIAESTDFLVQGNTFTTEGTPAPVFIGSAVLSIDFGSAFGTVSKNNISDNPAITAAIVCTVGAHDIAFEGNAVGYTKTSGAAAYVFLGCPNNSITGNIAIGSAGGATSGGIKTQASANLSVNIASTGNYISNNIIRGFPANQAYSIAAGDLLISSDGAGNGANAAINHSLSIGGGTALASSNQSGTGSLCMTINCAMNAPSFIGQPTNAQGGSLVAIISGQCNGTATASQTISLYPLGQSSGLPCTITGAPNGNIGTAIATSHTVKNLRVQCNTPGVNASSGVFTVYKNGIAQALTGTTGTAAFTSDTNQAHNFNVAAGDTIQIAFTTQAAETLGSCSASIEVF